MLRQSIAIAVVSCIVGIAVGHRAAAVFAKVQPSEPIPDESLMVLDCTKPILVFSDQPPTTVPLCLQLNMTHAIDENGQRWKFSSSPPPYVQSRSVQISAAMANGYRVSLFAQSNQ